MILQPAVDTNLRTTAPTMTSIAPLAWVEPGTHKLTLQMDNDLKAKNSDQPQEVTISAKLEADKKYRIARKDGTVMLVPDFER